MSRTCTYTGKDSVSDEGRPRRAVLNAGAALQPPQQERSQDTVIDYSLQFPTATAAPSRPSPQITASEDCTSSVMMPDREIPWNSMHETSDLERLSDVLDAWTQMANLSASVGDFVLRKKISVTRDRHRERANQSRTNQEQQDLPCSCRQSRGRVRDNQEEDGSSETNSNKRIRPSSPHVEYETSFPDNEATSADSFTSQKEMVIDEATSSVDRAHHVASKACTATDLNAHAGSSNALPREQADTPYSLEEDLKKVRRLAQLLLHIKAANAKFRDEILATMSEVECTNSARDRAVADDHYDPVISESE